MPLSEEIETVKDWIKDQITAVGDMFKSIAGSISSKIDETRADVARVDKELDTVRNQNADIIASQKLVDEKVSSVQVTAAEMSKNDDLIFDSLYAEILDAQKAIDARIAEVSKEIRRLVWGVAVTVGFLAVAIASIVNYLYR